MLDIKISDNYSRVIIASLNNSITDRQRNSINKRLKMDHVVPASIYKHRKYNAIVLGCINTNLPDNKPFYFIYWDNGQEKGKGYDFINNNSSYSLILDIQEQQKEVI
ncbi:hypothetical protein [Oceanobacillus sp. FSL H7-0719]|uniref:hypothetical protein n=1 Tax=Oceanobacillus sp. FSL H7-0719 TaxID=2954507 RepID=UPI0032491754